MRRGGAEGFLVVAADHGARSLPGGTAGPLFRRGPGGRDRHQSGHPAGGVAAGFAGEPRVDDQPDAGNGQRGFGQRGGDDHAGRVSRGPTAHGPVLAGTVDLAMQFQDLDGRADLAAQRSGHLGDFPCPGDEDQGIDGGIFSQCPAVGRRGSGGHMLQEAAGDSAFVQPGHGCRFPPGVQPVQGRGAVDHRSRAIAVVRGQ